jgi:pimeloyl-ACP methyl ester carboxylesterase
MDRVPYDEFSMFHENAEEFGLPYESPPTVRRTSVPISGGRTLSALVWGSEPPDLVLLHGGGQNAHTWDTVAMALKRPAVANDLPGHGHSDWRADGDYWPWANAEALATAIEAVAPKANVVVGMSLGGLSAFRLAAARPDLVPHLVVVDVTPGVHNRVGDMTPEQRGPVALIGGPPSFDSFEDMLQALAATMPHRPLDSLRPGLRHNAREMEDGRWGWRYDRLRPPKEGETLDFGRLWDDVAAIEAPLLLVVGGRSSHVHEDDVAELRRRRPDARVEVVEAAGHSVQSDAPLLLAGLIESFASRA